MRLKNIMELIIEINQLIWDKETEELLQKVKDKVLIKVNKMKNFNNLKMSLLR